MRVEVLRNSQFPALPVSDGRRKEKIVLFQKSLRKANTPRGDLLTPLGVDNDR